MFDGSHGIFSYLLLLFYLFFKHGDFSRESHPQHFRFNESLLEIVDFLRSFQWSQLHMRTRKFSTKCSQTKKIWPLLTLQSPASESWSFKSRICVLHSVNCSCALSNCFCNFLALYNEQNTLCKLQWCLFRSLYFTYVP